MVRLIITAVLIILQSASGQVTKQAAYPTEEWKKQTLAEQGLDPEILNDLVNEIRFGGNRDIHGILIVRNGYLVLEEYFQDYNRIKIHTLQSVSKSFTSALIGIAIEQGKINSVDEKVLSFFPDIMNIENLDDRKKEMKLKDILTMRSGTDYHERGSGSPHYILNSLPTGWDRFYLNRPMISKPGTSFLYDSGGVILLSAILKRHAGMHADLYADKYLFPYLGIKKTHWFRNSEGHPHTGGGLHLLPLDMAKFGLLYLRNGRWEDHQIVPEEWIKESFKMHVKFDNSRGGYDVGYGYLWWILKPDPDGDRKHNIYAAKGFMGQYIFVIPEHNMVVVFTGGEQSARGMRRPIGYLYSHILPAVEK